MKRKITLFGIWLIITLGILGAFYGVYDLYFAKTENSEDSEGTLLKYRTAYLIAILFIFIISIGLIVRNKISRWLTLLFSYYNIVAMISLVILVIAIDSEEILLFSQVALILLIILSSLFVIYVLSNQEALKLFSIHRKSDKKEISILIVMAALIVLLPLLSFLPLEQLTASTDSAHFDLEIKSESISEKQLTSLEKLGDHIYLREGCVICHFQMQTPKDVASLKDDDELEGVFRWGSHRRGPSLGDIANEFSDKELFMLLQKPPADHEKYLLLFETEIKDIKTIKEEPKEIDALISYIRTFERR